MGTPEAHRHAKALHGTNGDVSTPGARRFEHDEGQRVGCRDHPAAGHMGAIHDGAEIADFAGGARILQEATESPIELEVIRVRYHDLDSKRFGARAHNGDGLRMAIGGNQEPVALSHPPAHRHRLGGGRPLVEE